MCRNKPGSTTQLFDEKASLRGGFLFTMKKSLIYLSLVLLSISVKAQELYVFSEPASNMPANTFAPRMKAVIGKRENTSAFQRYNPELQFGLSKKFMLHGGVTFSNMMFENVQWEGAYLYGKYRFYSSDKLHQHFRMAAFGEIGYSRNEMMNDEVSARGDNTALDIGLIATQLKNKFVVSATTSYLKVLDKNLDEMHHETVDEAINYSLSAGYLVLPLEYTSYDQLNLNLYAEVLGQRTFGKKSYFIDVAPAIQFIFNSNSKLNVGYRFQVAGDALRGVEKSFLVSFEHTFFNAL